MVTGRLHTLRVNFNPLLRRQHNLRSALLTSGRTVFKRRTKRTETWKNPLLDGSKPVQHGIPRHRPPPHQISAQKDSSATATNFEERRNDSRRSTNHEQKRYDSRKSDTDRQSSSRTKRSRTHRTFGSTNATNNSTGLHMLDQGLDFGAQYSRPRESSYPSIYSLVHSDHSLHRRSSRFQIGWTDSRTKDLHQLACTLHPQHASLPFDRHLGFQVERQIGC